jgi:hypothetical protein
MHKQIRIRQDRAIMFKLCVEERYEKAHEKSCILFELLVLMR